jgi:hypothetical protein
MRKATALSDSSHRAAVCRSVREPRIADDETQPCPARRATTMLEGFLDAFNAHEVDSINAAM